MAQHDSNVLIPMKLDAFVFNKPVCDGGDNKAKIAPITQPNYSFLRLDDGYLQSDILNPVDLHRAWPSEHNSRFTDLGTSKPFRQRQGVYLHWTLPLVYRSGSTKPPPPPAKTAENPAPGTPAPTDPPSETPEPAEDVNTPTFHDVPARWLVIRQIKDLKTVEPEEARTKIQKITCWVIESDRRQNITQLDETVDLQVDVSPFINTPDSNYKNVDLKSQAEIFIGEKIRGWDWKERGSSVDRVNLKLTNSSNQLFADYQPHCSNVFSMLDNFEYETDEDGNKKYLTKADVSYYVIGWHWKPETDLFTSYLKDETFTREDTISSLKMEIKGADEASLTPEMDEWLKLKKPTRSVCHATLYNVHWSDSEAPKNIPADKYAEVINGTLPIAVGTTPLDALTTYAESHQSIDCGTPRELEKIISSLEKHLLARDDGVETQFEAADMLYNWNYLRLEGGSRYYVSGGDGTHSGASLPEKALAALTEINRQQALLDGINRRIKQLRWSIFSEWWKFCIHPEPTKAETDTRKRVDEIAKVIKRLEDKAENIKTKISEISKKNESFQPGTRPTYYQQRDPTLLVGAVKSGWERDYLKKLKIRLDNQVVRDWKSSRTFIEDEWSEVWKVMGLMPEKLYSTVDSLLKEFVILDYEPITEPKNPITRQPPLFHDIRESGKDGDATCPPKPPTKDALADDTPWRDRWNDTQPWFPLFLEWEVEHIDIPYEYWNLQEHKSSHEKAATIHYNLRPDLVDGEKDISKIPRFTDNDLRDDRSLSGRVLILPQPSFSLEAKINQLFADTPAPLLDSIISPDDKLKLETKLHNLGFISAPLAGLTSHMITLEQGNHVKPNLKVPSTGDLIPIKDAYRDQAGLTKDRLQLIDIESDVTPYGTSMKRPEHEGETAFKPVTHGQFKFTKLNIIDKFGQAIHVIDPRPSETPQQVWPCISDWFKPHDVPGQPKTPNVIERGNGTHAQESEYIQIPPYINQPSRLNAAFIINNPPPKISSLVDPPAFWCPTNEWEQPIWGWVVVNYANYGIQIFLPDGTFYREVRLAEGRSMTSGEWLPFAEPKNPTFGNSPQMLQLANLVKELGDYQYLQEFVAMINEATLRLTSPPSAYAEFTNALIGRPLALVNMGWSLELSENQLQSQLTGDNPQTRFLLPDRPKDELIPRETYEFPIKFGDRERGFDGLVGFFKSKDPNSEGHKVGDAFDLKEIFTHHIPAGASECKPQSGGEVKGYTYLKRIVTENYPKLESFYTDPDLLVQGEGEEEETFEVDASIFENAYNKQISKHAFAALVDPFSPIHGYTGILPVREIILPNWTWQTAMEKMKAFFHAGPVLVVHDVPEFKPSRELQDEAPVKKIEKEIGEVGVQLPSISSEQWVWLQPYMQYPPQKPVDPEKPPGPESQSPKEKYMSVSIDTMDQNARLEEGPYTAIEGYLQLAEAPNAKPR